MLFEERLHSIECRIVFKHLFRCSMCKSHGMLAPILPLSLNPVESARELARLIVVSSITLPDISDQDQAGSNLAQSPSS